MNNKHNGRDSHASSQCLKLSSCCWVCSHSSSCSSDTAALSTCDHLLATGSGQDGHKNWLWFHKCIQCYYMFRVSSVGWGHLSWEHMFNMNYYHVVLCDSGATHFCTLKLMMKPLAASLFMWNPAVWVCKHLRLVSSVSLQTVSSKQDCQPGYHFMRVPVLSPSCTKVGCAYYCIITYY